MYKHFYEKVNQLHQLCNSIIHIQLPLFHLVLAIKQKEQ